MKEMRFSRSGATLVAAMLAISPIAAHAQKAMGQAPKKDGKGWVGVLITTGIGEQNAEGKLVFNDYPVIESIDPGSPAEKAGLRAGDMLISINKQDFKKDPIPMNDLLRPGSTLTFRYRRDNVARISKMIVAERPAGTSRVVRIYEIGPDPGYRRAQAEEMLKTARVRGMLAPPAVSIAPLIFGTGIPSIAIAGAEMTQLNEGLRELVNLKGDGIFIVNVTMPSIAAEAGLRSGDVIVRAANQSVENPGQLIEIMRAAVDRSLALQILRKQKEQNLTLRW